MARLIVQHRLDDRATAPIANRQRSEVSLQVPDNLVFCFLDEPHAPLIPCRSCRYSDSERPREPECIEATAFAVKLLQAFRTPEKMVTFLSRRI